MALSTKSIVEWAGSIRNIFKTGDVPAEGTRSPEREKDDLFMDDESTDDEQEPRQQQLLHIPPIERIADGASSSGYSTQDEDGEEMVEISLEERMELAKQRYPGAKNWARDEERLFEILFSRQDLPMMPTHWSIDFRGFPLTERVFETSNKHPPIVYACGKNGMTDFNGKRHPFNSARKIECHDSGC